MIPYAMYVHTCIISHSIRYLLADVFCLTLHTEELLIDDLRIDFTLGASDLDLQLLNLLVNLVLENYQKFLYRK